MLRLPVGFTLKQVTDASSSVTPATVQNSTYAPRIEAALTLLDRALTAMNRTPADVRITSILRSTSRNEAVGGAQHSHHVSGYAVDFYLPGVDHGVVFEALKPLAGVLGYDELAVYDDHIHLSADPRRRGKLLDFRTRKVGSGRTATPPNAPKKGNADLALVLALAILGLVILMGWRS